MENNLSAQAPQIGIYQVINVYNEMHNGKETPIAEVIFKAPNWSAFDMKIRKLRLRGLFNTSSIGPKCDYSGNKLKLLYLHMIQIINKTETPNPKDPSKTLYTLEWNAFKPANYKELLQDDMDRLSDLHEDLQADLQLSELFFMDDLEDALFNDMIQALTDNYPGQENDSEEEDNRDPDRDIV